MSIITIDPSSLGNASDDARMHLMPCEIEHNGDAQVSSFFTPSIREDSTSTNEVMTASFRGRPLKGQKFEVPSGYKGVVLREHRKPFSEDEDREVKVTQKFDHFTQWNLDSVPSANDKCVKAMQWIDIAKAIHGNASDESGQKSIVGK